MNAERLIGAVAALLGAWLFFSPLVWHHSQAQTLNASITGAIAGLFGMLAYAKHGWARIGVALAGVWLFFSSAALYFGAGTFANDILVATILFSIGVLPDVGRRHDGQQDQAPRVSAR